MTTAKRRNPNGSGNISERKDGLYELTVFVDTLGRPTETQKRRCYDDRSTRQRPACGHLSQSRLSAVGPIIGRQRDGDSGRTADLPMASVVKGRGHSRGFGVADALFELACGDKVVGRLMPVPVGHPSCPDTSGRAAERARAAATQAA